VQPRSDQGAVEAEIERTIGATKVLWLPCGLSRDQQKYGTRGHVDIVAAIPSPGIVPSGARWSAA
jgi:agmatine deiminase